MAKDEDMHALATAFPGVVLGLLGLRPRGRYRAESVAVKATARTADLVFLPEAPGDPRVYLEWQRRRDATAERRLLEEMVVHCGQLDSYSPVIAALVYADDAARDAALAADVTYQHHGDVVRFSPLRVVLSEIEPDALLARGGDALLALPIVGSEAQVKAGAEDWLLAIRAKARTPRLRKRATEVFLKLLGSRLDRIDVATLFRGSEGLMEDTATGRALINRAQVRAVREAILTVLSARIGEVPAWVVERLEKERDLDTLKGILASAACTDAAQGFDHLF